MTDNSYSQLFQFLGAYFNEDWMCESELADDIVRSFVNDSTAETIAEVNREITMLLEMHMVEPELREFLQKNMSCCYCYWHEWASGEAWLNHVLNVFGE
ncbi:contact-dependent growth inhibition system immunity protein [Pseudomonas sp. GT1P32]